jgi:geranylgeranyl pyrophosphate synthase
MHRLKTGALIQASVQLGAICAGHHEGSSYDALATFGAEIGLAFQIQDDILDVTGSTATLGRKPARMLNWETHLSQMYSDSAVATRADAHRDQA